MFCFFTKAAAEKLNIHIINLIDNFLNGIISTIQQHTGFERTPFSDILQRFFLETFVKMLAIGLGDFMGAKPASRKTI
jgi:hypothetical protein